MSSPLMNTLSGISQDGEHYTKQAFMRIFNVEESLLEALLSDEIDNALKNPDNFLAEFISTSLSA